MKQSKYRSKYRYGPGREEYVSEFGQFLGDYLRSHPEVVEDQRKGWRIWWERPATQALAEMERVMHADISRQPYHSYNYE